jgi:hypothetical protein
MFYVLDNQTLSDNNEVVLNIYVLNFLKIFCYQYIIQLNKKSHIIANNIFQ